MKQKEIEAILKEGEGALIEFKKSVSASLGKEITAFANTAGGRLLIGIDDDGGVIGCDLTNRLKSQIQDIANNCDPKVLVNIGSCKYNNKEIVVVTVPESKDKPVQCSEGFYLREGANSQKMSREEIFYWAQKTRKIRFENQLNPEFNYPADFNFEVFRELTSRMNITNIEDPENILHNLGLGVKDPSFSINHAGILLFGKKRDLYIRQAYITCVLYKGTDNIKIIDRKDFRDGLVKDYENAFMFLEQHLRLEYLIEGGGPRKEIPEIPYEALKEALLNAIIHRDYYETGARVMVEIYDDRVQIINPGELLFEKKDFGNISIARNPIIFDIFNRLRLVEKVGTGIKRIVSLIKERGLKVDFETGQFFKAIFSRTEQVPSKYRASTEQVEIKPAILKNPNFTNILRYCLEPKKRDDIQKHVGLTQRENFRVSFLIPLLKEGLLELSIPDKPQSSKQKYITTQKGIELLNLVNQNKSNL